MCTGVQVDEDLQKLAEGALTRPVADLLVDKVLIFPDGKTEIVWKQ